MIMMNLRLIVLLYVLPLTEAQDEPERPLRTLFNSLFAPVFNLVVSSTCDSIVENFVDVDGFSGGCTCRGYSRFLSLFRGLEGELICQDDPICLINDDPSDMYCGQVAVDVTFNNREGVRWVTGCLDVETNLPEDFPMDKVADLPQICVRASKFSEGLDVSAFDSCIVDIGSTRCDLCIICRSGDGSPGSAFQFDCTNININPNQGDGDTIIEGPKNGNCAGFGPLFGT